MNKLKELKKEFHATFGELDFKVRKVLWKFVVKAYNLGKKAKGEDVEKVLSRVKHCRKKGCLLCLGAEETVAFIRFDLKQKQQKK